MKRATWFACCAAVILTATATRVWAQEDIDLGLIADPSASPPAAPGEEKSMLGVLEPVAANGDRDFCQCIGESNSDVVHRIEKALSNPLASSGIDFADAPLEEVVAAIQENYGIPIQVDIPALDEIGIGPDEPVTTKLHEISLRSALRLMLKPLQLTYIIRDEVLIITTPEQAEHTLIVCVYDVRHLLDGPVGTPDFDSLIDTIASCVHTETWKENGGGQAEIRPLKPGLLVISQMQAVHEDIHDLLTTIRALPRNSPANDDATKQSADSPGQGQQVVTRYYSLRIPPTTEPNAVLMQVRELITKSLPDEPWAGRLEDGQPVILAVLPDRVIVRHTPEVQDEVEALLVDSGLGGRAPTDGQGIGGNFGGGGFGGDGGGGFFQPRQNE